MSKFKIGDMVRVTTTRFGPNQYGMEGEIAMFREDSENLPIRVSFGSGGSNVYHETDLTLLDGCRIMPDPEFDLEEIERAERLIHE